MRVMVIVKATKSSEAGVMPSELTPELRANEERLRAEIQLQQQAS